MGIRELPYGRMKMFTSRVGPTSRSLSTSKCLEAAVSKATHEVSLFCCVARAWGVGQAAASDLQNKSPASCSRSASGVKSAGNSPGGSSPSLSLGSLSSEISSSRSDISSGRCSGRARPSVKSRRLPGRRCSVQEDSYVVVAGEVLKGSEVRSVPTVFPRVRRHVPVDCQESTWNA